MTRHPLRMFTWLVVMAACGGVEEKRPDVAGAGPTVTASPRASARSARPPTPSVGSAPSASPAPPAPPAPKGRFVSLALATTSGNVDRIGNKDGAFAADGVRDLVFDAEVEGAVVAIIIVSTDDDGRRNGAFSADTYVGTQTPPSEAGAEVRPGLMTAGIGVYENDKLMNASDGSLAPLPEGRHSLTLHVSSREAPKGNFKAFVVLEDRSLVGSPVVSSK